MAKKDLSSKIHDINNLLASIMLSVELSIRDNKVTPAQKKHLQGVLSDAKKIKKAIESLRD